MNSLKNLSDNELTGRLRQLVRKEQDLTLSILPHLAEVGRRQLYLKKAYSTLTEYCIHELGYGDSSASRRVRAARVIKDIPEVYHLMKSKKLSFSAVVQVYSVLTPQNKDQLLSRLLDKSRSQIERIMAEYQMPRKIMDQAKPTMVKKLVPVEGAPARANSTGAGQARCLDLGEMTRHSDGSNGPTDNGSTLEMKVVLEKMYEIRFAGDDELMELIQWLKSHLSHKFPKGVSYLDIFKYAINYVRDREDLARCKRSNRRSNARTDTRYIPKAIKQKVWKKHNGRCAFVGSNGKRCESTYSLQYDHYPIPYARGGRSTASNLRLLCAKHNKYTAEEAYGKRHIEKHYIKETPVVYVTGAQKANLIIPRRICYADGIPWEKLSRTSSTGRCRATAYSRNVLGNTTSSTTAAGEGGNSMRPSAPVIYMF